MLNLVLPAATARPVDRGAVVTTAIARLRERSACLNVVILVPDRTREIGASLWVSALVAQLQNEGCPAPRVLFASGTHAPMSESERASILGPVAARVEHAAHDCDAADLVDAGGGPLHPWVVAADALVIVSRLTLHYLAGVGGGRKMLFPGVTSRAVATALHAHSLDENGARPATIAPGVVEDNPMHQAIVKRVNASRLPPLVSIVLEFSKEEATAAHVHTDLVEAFAPVAAVFSARRTVDVSAPLDGAWTTCPPRTGETLIQAHKALLAVSAVVKPRGRIVVEAPLARGPGNARLGEWLTDSPLALQRQLSTAFAIGKQTAWSLARVLQTYSVVFTGTSDQQRQTLKACGLRLMKKKEAQEWVRAAGPRVGQTDLGGSVRFVVNPASEI